MIPVIQMWKAAKNRYGFTSHVQYVGTAVSTASVYINMTCFGLEAESTQVRFMISLQCSCLISFAADPRRRK